MDERNPATQSPETALSASSITSSELGSESKGRKVVIVGIPGVGKSTVVKKIVELMSERKLEANVVNYGTVMMEEASKLQIVKSRDEMRRLPVEIQRRLQVHAASRISLIEDEFVIIDTHLFIKTKEGLWPGMPVDVLHALKPTHLVCVLASVDEILTRREKDTTRVRERATRESLQIELDALKSFLFASSLISGCPVTLIINSDGRVEESAKSIINSVFVS